MPSQMELLGAAQIINRNVDPDGDHQTPDSGSFENLNRAYPMQGRALVAQTMVHGDDLTDTGAGDLMGDDPDQLEELNENNKRVALRLQAEKERVTKALKKQGPAMFGRAGSPANPGDLASGGKGGDFGEAAAQGRDLGEDARQQASAWARQSIGAKAADEASKAALAGKPAPLAKGKAQAAESALLGDDSKPAKPADDGKPAPGSAWAGDPAKS